MEKAEAKRKRVISALEHREGDRVPIGEFFWSGFLRRARQSFGRDFDPYRHWDLDLVVINPNMDPHIKGVAVLEDTPDRKVVKTGYEATVEWSSRCPMPAYIDFATKTYGDMEAFVFDSPLDERRYTAAIDDHLNAVGDVISLHQPAWMDRVKARAEDFCIFGSVCEPFEMIWRILGTTNVLTMIAEEPDKVARFVERLGDFLVGIVRGQVAAARGILSGIFIWGDVAYDHGMFFSPDYWRGAFKPQLKRICAEIHAAGLKAVYHGCGNASAIFEDLIGAGVDACQPLEAKSGLEVVGLKRRFGGRWAFMGNLDVRVMAKGDREDIRREVLRKLNAAKGGGYIPQSDHSIPENVSPESYDYVVRLLREFGTYPLRLAELDEPL